MVWLPDGEKKLKISIRFDTMHERDGHTSKQASQLINKDIISMNNIQGQAARKAHKAQHCWPPCKKNLTHCHTDALSHVYA